MIRINQIKLDIGTDEKILNSKIQKLLRLKNSSFTYSIVKKSIDARKKEHIMYIYSVDVKVDGIDETALVRKLNNKDIIINTIITMQECHHTRHFCSMWNMIWCISWCHRSVL